MNNNFVVVLLAVLMVMCVLVGSTLCSGCSGYSMPTGISLAQYTQNASGFVCRREPRIVCGVHSCVVGTDLTWTAYCGEQRYTCSSATGSNYAVVECFPQ